MNADEARALGYVIDESVYPWAAYKGPRFDPEELQRIDTPAYTVLVEHNEEETP